MIARVDTTKIEASVADDSSTDNATPGDSEIDANAMDVTPADGAVE